MARLYSGMRRGIVPHPSFILEENISDLDGFNFVFVCVDTPGTRGILFERLKRSGTPFVDVGMELELLEEQQQLIGACRYTFATAEKSDHLRKYVSTSGEAGNNIYRRNIQTTDINALNAALAVVRWKRFCGFYQDIYSDHQSVFVINTHQLTRDEVS